MYPCNHGIRGENKLLAGGGLEKRRIVAEVKRPGAGEPTEMLSNKRELARQAHLPAPLNSPGRKLRASAFSTPLAKRGSSPPKKP